MLSTGWTRQQLDSADTEDVVRIMWVLDAQRVARIAERLDEAASYPIPESLSGPARGKAVLDRAEVAGLRDSLDEYLLGGEE